MLTKFLRAAAGSSGLPITLVNTTAYFTTAATSSLTMNVPSGTTSGDLMIAWLTKSGGSNTYTQPSGWTEVIDLGAASRSFMVAYRVADVGEPANYTWTTPDTGNNKAGNIITFRNAAYDVTAGASTGTTVAPSRTVSANNSWLLLIGRSTRAGDNLNYAAPVTTIVRDADNTIPESVVQYRVVNTGATGTVTGSGFDDDGANPISASLVISPT
jgi:hypothetical protein